MNNMAYGNQKPDEVSAKVAELVQAETGEEPKFEIQEGDASKTSVKTVVVEGLDLLFGGRKATNLFTINFEITSPRPMTLCVPINRQGIGCHAGGLMFVTPLKVAVPGEVVLKPPKFFSGAKFEGDPAVATKLNGNSALMKRLKDFVRTKGNLGGVDIELTHLFKIQPDPEKGAILVALNMPKSLKMGFAVSLEIKDFAEIAAIIESAN